MRKLKMLALLGLATLFTSTAIVGAEESTTGTQNVADEVKCYVTITGSNPWLTKIPLNVSKDAAKIVYGEGTEGVTAIDALVEGCYYAFYKEDPSLEDLESKKGLVRLLMGNTTVAEGWVDGVMGDYGEGDNCWLFADGKISPSVGTVDYEVIEGADLWFYYANWMLGYRGYFDKAEYTAKEGEAVEVILNGVPIMNEMFGTYEMVPVAGTITIKGNGKEYTVKCDDAGKAVIEKLPAGEYTLEASWQDTDNGYVLVSPTAKLVIQEVVTEVPTTKANVPKAKIKSLTNVKSKKAKLKINKISGVTGYQVKYAASKKFSGSKTVRTTKTTYTIKKLKKGKKYYVKVRAYKTVDGTRYYGKWSKVKKVKIRK